MEGYNVTIILVGASGSGKSHTMVGNREKNPGILPLTLETIFAYIHDTPKRDYMLKLSYFRVIDNEIQDVLSSG
jgi:hypothetical protein